LPDRQETTRYSCRYEAWIFGGDGTNSHRAASAAALALPYSRSPHFFLWCSVINDGILILWTLFGMFAPDLVHRIQNRWFPIHRETYNVVMYAFPGLFKMLFLVFNLIPHLALLLIQ